GAGENGQVTTRPTGALTLQAGSLLTERYAADKSRLAGGPSARRSEGSFRGLATVRRLQLRGRHLCDRWRLHTSRRSAGAGASRRRALGLPIPPLGVRLPHGRV